MTHIDADKQLAVAVIAMMMLDLAEALRTIEMYLAEDSHTARQTARFHEAEKTVDACEEFIYSPHFTLLTDIDPDIVLDSVYDHYKSKTFRDQLKQLSL